MGREIEDSHFRPEDFAEFQRRLREETALLEDWLEGGAFSEARPMGGFELEAWLVDERGHPAGINEAYLARLDDPLVVPELATFNVELNGEPQPLEGDALTRLYRDLRDLWGRCDRTAGAMGARLAMIGILPTARPADFTLANMSPLQRYAALNEQVLRLRRGRPIEVDIQGEDRLRLAHRDVMLEAAATSFQIHLKVPAPAAGRYYNASKILSGPMVALSANAPFLFGRDLWAETRIPLFEQSVAVAGSDLTQRVSFGVGYVHSVVECFLANRDRYPLLLPHLMDERPETLSHLRLHNGTIWRWNRPLIGFDDDGSPHLRIEHRVVPSGPTVADGIANAAFYFGAVHALARREPAPERELPFETARRNFYNGARYGLAARADWLGGGGLAMDRLCLDELLPLARDGLAELGIAEAEARHWLGLVEARVRRGVNGATWQRRWVARHGPDMEDLVGAYLERQSSGLPVHRWDL
jgi:gamma-glutamyl:cysteine ligase YbdK (ATP-grasp superfamily)